MLRGMLLVAACALLPTFVACGPVDAQSLDPSVTTAQPLVEVCPITDPDCLPDTCDPIYDWGCEPCPRDNPEAWCYEPPCTPADGLINTYTTYRVGREPNASLEVNSLGGSRCNRLVVTGIGAHIVSDSNYAMLHVEYRQPYANGTLGPRTTVRTGKSPTLAPEAALSVPDGYAIVGVAAGQHGTHNLKTLVVYYRRIELTAAGVRMTGPLLPLSWEGASTGLIDSQYTNPYDNKVLVGVGFSSAVEQTKTLAAHVGTLP